MWLWLIGDSTYRATDVAQSVNITSKPSIIGTVDAAAPIRTVCRAYNMLIAQPQHFVLVVGAVLFVLKLKNLLAAPVIHIYAARTWQSASLTTRMPNLLLCVFVDTIEGHFDIGKIRQNAIDQGLELSQIAIVYEGLTDEEQSIMRQVNVIAYKVDDNCVVRRFTKDGEILFKEKARSVLCLGA